MATVSAKLAVPYPTGAAESLWYDTGRWPGFVDGFGWLKTVEGQWPGVGARVVWDTKPGGRGRVTETVTAYEPRRMCVTEVEDDQLSGTQTVAFSPHAEGTTMQLSLQYAIKARTPLTPVVDLFFVRRTQRESLQRTLRRFALELRDEISPPV
ncbi:MAG: hypothetical protein JWN65_1906 [Solirubrobacterales bacterium]|nr:hypothetical protein [Solirubrobacterales bacterium]